MGTSGPGRGGDWFSVCALLVSHALVTVHQLPRKRNLVHLFSDSHKGAYLCHGPVNGQYKMEIERHMRYLKYAYFRKSSTTSGGNTYSNMVTIGQGWPRAHSWILPLNPRHILLRQNLFKGVFFFSIFYFWDIKLLEHNCISKWKILSWGKKIGNCQTILLIYLSFSSLISQIW